MSTPPEPQSDAQREIARLLGLMATLRNPDGGCPWDLAQTFDTIAPYTIEEAYEVADTIARRDMPALPDELGDLLFQVVYHARMAEEAGLFAFPDVARAITDKMIRRHPHIFPAAEPAPPGWEAQKQAERTSRGEHGTLAGIPAGLPALTRALKVTQRAARVGFDWPGPDQVLEKLEEEIAELRAELPTPGAANPPDPAHAAARIADELGDLLFVAANLARKLALDPEACLRAATAKFTRRFTAVEHRLAARGFSPADVTLDAMEAEWAAVKHDERNPP